MAAHSVTLPIAGSAEPEPRRALAHVAVIGNPVEALGAWEAIEKLAPCSAFQTRAWLLPWMTTLGAALRPAFVVARDIDGDVIAFLPLGLSRKMGLCIATFLGGKDAGLALGLFHPDLSADETLIRDVLARAAKEAGIDLFVLRNQPYRWDNRDNPLATVRHQPSPSFNHSVPLSKPADRFFVATLSKKTRKRLRWKESKLTVLGPIVHEEARTAEAAHAIIEAYLAQKRERFRRLGIRDESSEESQRRFLALASNPGSGATPAVELHALTCAGKIIATFAGAAHRERFSGMIVSFESHDDVARYGPGELLISKILAAKCNQGLKVFDLGIGEARYKDTFCPEVEPLFDTIVATTAMGHIAALIVALSLRSKRIIKQTPWLWIRLRRVSRVLASLSGGRTFDQAA